MINCKRSRVESSECLYTKVAVKLPAGKTYGDVPGVTLEGKEKLVTMYNSNKPLDKHVTADSVRARELRLKVEMLLISFIFSLLNTHYSFYVHFTSSPNSSSQFPELLLPSSSSPLSPSLVSTVHRAVEMMDNFRAPDAEPLTGKQRDSKWKNVTNKRNTDMANILTGKAAAEGKALQSFVAQRDPDFFTRHGIDVGKDSKLVAIDPSLLPILIEKVFDGEFEAVASAWSAKKPRTSAGPLGGAGAGPVPGNPGNAKLTETRTPAVTLPAAPRPQVQGPVQPFNTAGFATGEFG